MKRQRQNKFSNSKVFARGGGLMLMAVALLLCPRAVTAQSSAAQAEAQYQKAEQMRTAFEAQPEDKRPLSGYKKLVAAYRRVYLLSSSAGAVTPALVEVGELYHEMGDQFDQAYYQNALATYKFLISQYPGSKFRAEAIFQIGKIEKEDVQNAAEAKDAFAMLLKKYPHSERAGEARTALKEIAAGQLAPAESAQKSAADTADGSRNSEPAPTESPEEAKKSTQDTQTARETQSGNARVVTEQLSPEEKQNGPAE